MPFEVQQMDDQHLVDLASRLERAERRAKNLQRLLELGQGLTTEATKGEWSRRVAGEVLRAARCRWAAYCVAGREVDRIFLQRQHAQEAHVTIRAAGYLRRCAGDSWVGQLPCRVPGARFGLPDEACWYLPIRVHESVRGGLLLPQACLGRVPCGDTVELLGMLGHQVSLAAELAELHGDVVRAATFDRMTAALNRSAWLAKVEQRLQAMRGTDGGAAVVLFDLDQFKEVNDRLGHAAGDEFLVGTAHAARSVLRGEDLFGRFGGDEFVVWLENLSTITLAAVIERLMVRVSAVASGVQQRMGDTDVQLGMSVGVAMTDPKHPKSVDELLEAADVALYEAKAAGRGTWRISGNGSGQARAS
jgi:diguanylate cyclase (GGDEF)-like protein